MQKTMVTSVVLFCWINMQHLILLTPKNLLKRLHDYNVIVVIVLSGFA